MKGNGYKAVVVNTNSYKATMPFEKGDVIVNWDGEIVEKANKYYA